MSRLDILKKRQAPLKEDISARLDGFLIGTVGKSASMKGHNLTSKVAGKTVTLYVRKAVAPMALEMSNRYRTLWKLLQALSKLNWELLNVENK